MRRRHPVLAVAVLFVALAGCSSPTTSGSPRTPDPHTTGAPTAPQFDPAPSTVVIEVAAGRATVAGPQGTSRLRVYGDGRVERTAPDSIGTVRLKLDDDGVATLLAAADRLGMLSDPDLGDVMITDVGSTSLTIRLQDRTIDLDVIGPGIKGVGSPSVERARADFSAFVAHLWSLDGVGIAQPPRTQYPQTVVLSAFTDDGSSSDAPWPLADPARSVFAASSCALVSGADVERLAALLAEQQRPNGREGEVTVATGDLGVPALVLHVSSEHPQCTPAPMVRTPLPRLPWTADGRERSGQWQRWQADGALERAADQHTLGLGDPGYLDDYEFQFVSGTVNGTPVVDVIGTPDDEHAGRDDMPSFVTRVDLSPADGPVVTRTLRT
ncbi:MAG: hypothetical protein WKF57_20215 [Nakamurella sp.]